MVTIHHVNGTWGVRAIWLCEDATASRSPEISPSEIS